MHCSEARPQRDHGPSWQRAGFLSVKGGWNFYMHKIDEGESMVLAVPIFD